MCLNSATAAPSAEGKGHGQGRKFKGSEGWGYGNFRTPRIRGLVSRLERIRFGFSGLGFTIWVECRCEGCTYRAEANISQNLSADASSATLPDYRVLQRLRPCHSLSLFLQRMIQGCYEGGFIAWTFRELKDLGQRQGAMISN